MIPKAMMPEPTSKASEPRANKETGPPVLGNGGAEAVGLAVGDAVGLAVVGSTVVGSTEVGSIIVVSSGNAKLPLSVMSSSQGTLSVVC